MSSVIAPAAALRRDGVPFLIATVVRVRGSSYRKPGARMVATEDRWVAGSVSGGCLEGDVLRRGWWRTRDGAVLVSYDSSDPDEPGGALGCGGVVDVLLERAPTDGRPDPLAFLEATIAAERRGAIATVFVSSIASLPVGARLLVAGDGTVDSTPFDEDLHARVLADCRDAIAAGRSTTRRYQTWRGEVEVLVEAIVPPVRLVMLGAGHDAVPLAELSRLLCWSVTVWDALGRFASRERFAGCEVLGADLDAVRARVDGADRAAAVVMGHHVGRDRAALAMLLESRAAYIGVLGPRHRLDRLLGELARPQAARDPRLRGPVGLDLGGETPEEIALAIAAEITAMMHRTTTAAPR